MGPSDFSRVHVAVGVLLQSTVIAAEHKPGEEYPFVAPRTALQLGNVLMSVRCVTDDQEFMRRPHALEGFDHEVGVVFRLESGNIEHVAVWFDSPTTNARVGVPLYVGAVRNHR